METRLWGPGAQWARRGGGGGGGGGAPLHESHWQKHMGCLRMLIGNDKTIDRQKPKGKQDEACQAPQNPPEGTNKGLVGKECLGGGLEGGGAY